MSTYANWDMNELGDWASDFHKDVHGFRPRGEGLFESRERLIALLESLDAHMDSMKETFAGRESLRADGWIVDETEPELIQQAKWLKEERDAELAETWCGGR